MIGVSKTQVRLMLKVMEVGREIVAAYPGELAEIKTIPELSTLSKAIGNSVAAFAEEFQGMMPAGATDVPDDFRQAMVEVSGGLLKLYDAVLQRARDYAKDDEEKTDAASGQPDGDMLDAGEAGSVS